MKAQELITYLEDSLKTQRPPLMFDSNVTRTRIEVVVHALELTPSSEHVRMLLCDILGNKANKRKINKHAVTILIYSLYDPDMGVRSSAADALATFGDPEAGSALLEQYFHEKESSPVRSMLLAALGAVKYEPAISVLLVALKSQDKVIQQCAAWSLGALHAIEARDILQQMLTQETNVYIQSIIRTSLEQIESEKRKLSNRE